MRSLRVEGNMDVVVVVGCVSTTVWHQVPGIRWPIVTIVVSVETLFPDNVVNIVAFHVGSGVVGNLVTQLGIVVDHEVNGQALTMVIVRAWTVEAEVGNTKLVRYFFLVLSCFWLQALVGWVGSRPGSIVS